MAQHNETGKKGEIAAANFLLKKGFEILAANYRFKKAEIDIIAKQNNVITFVEVKTRSTDFFGFPEEFVDKKKQQLIAKAAAQFIEENKILGELRFDIISVIETKEQLEIRHIEDAFFPIGE